MSFRTIVVKERCKLDLKMGYMVCRNEKEVKVHIPEISVLILESTAISLTTALLSELTKNNVKIIFCDEKHNPESELLPLYGNYVTSKKVENQMMWTKKQKAGVWAEIIKNKIFQQAKFLKELKLKEQSDMLIEYQKDVMPNDLTNREGHAAKVYFNALYGMDFARRVENDVNSALNYGYAILLSCFNREVVKNGYITQIGIWHKNEFNKFNLACDLMEPFRVLVDRIVFSLEDPSKYRDALLEIFNIRVKIGGKIQYFENAISVYCQSVFDALNDGNVDNLKFYEL